MNHHDTGRDRPVMTRSTAENFLRPGPLIGFLSALARAPCSLRATGSRAHPDWHVYYGEKFLTSMLEMKLRYPLNDHPGVLSVNALVTTVDFRFAGHSSTRRPESYFFNSAVQFCTSVRGWLSSFTSPELKRNFLPSAVTS